MSELPERILDVAWLAFSASQRRHGCDATALADALTAVAPLISADAYRRAASDMNCADDCELLVDMADELDPGGVT